MRADGVAGSRRIIFTASDHDSQTLVKLEGVMRALTEGDDFKP